MLNSKVPDGPLAQKWTHHRDHLKLVVRDDQRPADEEERDRHGDTPATGHGRLVDAALVGVVDRARVPSEPDHERCQHQRDQGGREERDDDALRVIPVPSSTDDLSSVRHLPMSNTSYYLCRSKRACTVRWPFDK